MNPLVQQLQQALDKIQPAADPQKICIAFSGGLDSRVLLELAWQLQQQTPEKLELRALHINHQLSPNANHWAEFCRQTCEQKNIPFSQFQIDTRQYSEASLEARARQARYQIFSQELQAGELLLQAHHRKDQAETLLLRLLRGAGTQGLASIPIQRPLGQGQLLRPLLNTPRETLEAFAREQQLHWIEDESNQKDHFDRNFVRLNILPLLAERFPAAEQNLALSARLAGESQQLHHDLAELDLQEVDADSTSLSITALLQLAGHRRSNLLRHWLQKRDFPLPSLKHWQQLDHLCQARQDAQPLVEWGEAQHRIQARRHRDRLYIQTDNHFQPLPQDWQTTWNNQPPLKTPCGYFNLQLQCTATGKIPKELQVTSRQGGETIRLPNRGSRDIKRLLQELNLPTWQRNQLPFIWHQGKLIAVGNRLIAEGWEAL
ncbi:tRNA lysidine(34) synthetase TilS [Marinospirillum sp.]|uniref:tRNA lysidine(34) synthetase TilS n=1 Tax=Marinospirillum sp. TaxID=2183934 RepID=UPI0028702F98|nr:tRNA lysidine(34) synthetase TilS [Marinospirillum sp.]MDR9469089.1 tRNA lysidine(34) synthetase TilS [Marinospirillum sp.]